MGSILADNLADKPTYKWSNVYMASQKDYKQSYKPSCKKLPSPRSLQVRVADSWIGFSDALATDRLCDRWPES